MNSKITKVLKWGIGFIALTLLVGVSLLLYELNDQWNKLPSEQAIVNYSISEKSNKVSAAFIHLDKLPEHVHLALLAATNSNYLMEGISWKKCIWRFITKKQDRECNADLPGFAARNMLSDLSPLRQRSNLESQLSSLLFTWKMDSVLTREQVVELVLNKTYFGNGAYGISNAANTYFKKSAIHLTISQAAILTGMIKAPSRYNPIRKPILSKQRRNFVLSQMLKRGMISKIELETSSAAALIE